MLQYSVYFEGKWYKPGEVIETDQKLNNKYLEPIKEKANESNKRSVKARKAGGKDDKPGSVQERDEG